MKTTTEAKIKSILTIVFLVLCLAFTGYSLFRVGELHGESKALSSQTDSLSQEIRTIERTITIRERDRDADEFLELCKRQYGIRTKKIVRKDGFIYYFIDAPKVDSALMLLPSYRDKITYDSVSDAWVVERVNQNK